MSYLVFSLRVIATGLLAVGIQLASAEVTDQQIDKLLSQMMLQEKASLTSGASMWITKPLERLGIPSIKMVDGPHGVRHPSEGQFGKSIPATCYPPAVTLASTWDINLAREVGSALGREAQSLGIQILLGPGTNIKRSPFGGRNFEYFSEDPVLSGQFSTAYIQGVQSQGVGVSLKHYAVNDQEHERMTISAEVSPRAMHEIYLRPFEMAVREAQPMSLMSAYNKVNGTYASSSEYLLNEVLRQQWGFDGIVISDWGAVDDRVQSIRARLHLQMPGDGGINDKAMVAAVESGELPEEELDEVVRSMLRTTLALHEDSGRYASYNQDQHHELARKVAAKGIVLLKNENNILPLGESDNIALIGNFAKVPRFQGAGSSLVTPTRIDTLVDSLEASFAPGYDLMGKTTPALIDQAVTAARAADKVVLVVGLTFIEESEGFDRSSYGIAPGHRELVDAVVEANPNVVVVLQNGSPVAMPWLDRVAGVVEAYLGGQASGSALADVLTGRVNPSGKLAETFPEKIEDNPTYISWAGEEGKTRYSEGIFVGYRYYDEKGIKPLFPFGFGLSYTTFEFSDLELGRSALTDNDGVSVSVKVKNTGSRAGEEVVQLYVRDVESSVRRPQKELKHFAKIMLKPGQEKTVSFNLGKRDFAYYSAEFGQWVSESGDFEIKVGNSSRNLPLQQQISLSVENPPKRLYTRYTLIKDIISHPIGAKLIEDFMNNPFGSRKPDVERSMTEEQKVEAMKWSIVIEAIIADMPLKQLIPFSGGKFREEELEQLLTVLNQ